MKNIIMIANFKFPKNWDAYFYLAKTLYERYNFFAVSEGMNKQLAFKNNVKLISKNEALKINIDIAILLSKSEGFPNVLMEYTSIWKSIVCHDNAGDALNYFIPGINSISIEDLYLDKNLDIKISNLITKFPLESNFKKISEIQ